MRNGVVAIVPLFFAIVMLFAFIALVGGGSDTLKRVTNVEHLSHLQDRLIYSVAKRYYGLKSAHPDWDEAKLQIEIDKYVRLIMKSNKIDD